MEINLQELGETQPLGLLTDECLTSYRKTLSAQLDEILDTADAGAERLVDRRAA